MIQNLRENFLYEKLPDAVIGLDERGLIAAVLGGFQDRLEDLRAYSGKLRFFFTTDSLPETGNNAVLVDVTTDYGLVVTRSLEIQDDTPSASNPSALAAWAGQQLNLTPDQFTAVRYGTDLLRQVDTNTLGYLADTLGAILYASPLSTDDTATQQQLVATYFPRLKIKGTVRSFEALGRILGFDDVKVTPLWSRVSPRQPQDIGNAANDPDFAQRSEYPPQQYFGVDYNPLASRDGPFFTWVGTVSNVVTDTNFYNEVVNGFSPFVTMATVASQGGTVVHPSTGSYALSGGDSYTKAKVTPNGAGVMFVALAQGEAYNGLAVNVVFSGTGSLAVLSITDQLSSVKYRSAFYDLAVTADMGKVEEVFGANAVRKNTYLASGSNTSDGVAVSPFRPWVAGSISTGLLQQDFLTATDVTNGTTVVTARHQAQATDRELNLSELVAAGVTVAQAFEEVRPATRFPRRAVPGFLIDDTVPYAFYGTQSLLFVSKGTVTYTGTDPNRPLPDMDGRIQVINGNGTFLAVAANDPTDPYLWHYLTNAGTVTLQGSYEFRVGTYYFNLTGDTGGNQVWAYYTVTSTETIRPEPSYATKYQDAISALDRPEDDDSGTHTINELMDDYPWRRDMVNGGELVEVDAYLPSGKDAKIVPVDSAECAFQDQTGAEYSVRAVRSSKTVHHRFLVEPRSTSPYVPCMLPIGYNGVFKNLASLTVVEVADINTFTDAETLFQPGYALYHTGLAQGVLVADLPKFFGAHHRTNLAGWLPFNEHAEDHLHVADHSPVDGFQYLQGVGPDDRIWDDRRGWFLRLQQNAIVSSDDVRGWGQEQTVSFWIKPVAGSQTQTIVRSGNLHFDCSSGSIHGYALKGDNTLALVGSGSIPAGDWRFVYLRRGAGQAVFGFATMNGTATESSLSAVFAADTDGNQLVVTSGTCSFGLHDLRVWSEQKTQAQMELARYHNPTPTIVNYPIGFMLTAHEQDRFGLRVLANGWVTTDVMPAYVRRPALAWIERYDDMGRYEGESRFKETGLGGGRALPTNYTLGIQYGAITATGTTVSSTGTGQLPGMNDLWLTDRSFGTYVVVVNGTGTDVATGSVPWPQSMVQTNPNRDRVWIQGDDGLVYEVTVDGTLSATELKASPTGRYRADSELLVDSMYAAVLDTGTFWSATPTHTVQGVLVGSAGTFTITTLP